MQKLIKTKKVNYFVDQKNRFCFKYYSFKGQKTYRFDTLNELKKNSQTLYQLGGKVKIN